MTGVQTCALPISNFMQKLSATIGELAMKKFSSLVHEFSKLIGFLVVALIAVGLVFNAGGVKDVLLELFNKIIGA